MKRLGKYQLIEGTELLENSQKTSPTVVVIFWARILCLLTVEEARFRMRIILGVVIFRSLACTQCVPGALGNGSGVAL